MFKLSFAYFCIYHRNALQNGLTFVLPRGIAVPLENFSLPPQNLKESGQSHLSNLNYILCGHLGKNGATPFRCGKVSRQRWRVLGWLPPKKVLNSHFERYLPAVQLKLTEYYVRISISLLYKPKPGEIPRFRCFFSEYLNFRLYFTEFRPILSSAMIMTSLVTS